MTSETTNEPKSAIYIDTENLGGSYTSVSNKAKVIQLALEQWPAHLPAPSRIRAYIDPRKENLWQEALSGFTGQRKGAFNVGIPGLAIETPALQQYGRGAAKNALDITLVLDALSDLIIGRADFAAVISNDSDFASLYFKLRELVKDGDLQPRAEINDIPLLLFTHDLAGISDEIRNLGKNVIPVITGINAPQYPAHPNTPLPNKESLQEKYSTEQLAGAVAIGFGRIRWEEAGSDVFTFNYRNVYHVIKGRWPYSEEATGGRSAEFSRWFHDRVWPVMQQHGTTVSNNQGGDPRNYSYHLPWMVRERLKVLNPE